MLYSVNAMVNGNVLACAKRFSSMKKANKYINDLIDTYSCQVNDVYDGNNGQEYVCNDYTRFAVKEINA